MELLAPAGSFAQLKAAISGGADAVYMGASVFSARAGAKNFSHDELETTIAICRGNGVKVYAAINTLVSDRELPQALDTARHFYLCGADAFILQDLGLAKAISENIPGAALHASTQLSCHNIYDAGALEKLGFSRIILARELSKEEIKLIKENTKCELEIFVHGALCMSVSGKCYFSSVIGRRSGNRGRCAQPCRLSYNGRYRLSLKDLCLGEHIKELEALGVCSLKIEGRMKGPAYAKTTSQIYKNTLKTGFLTQSDKNKLASSFSRQGFTDGYFTSGLGVSMFGRRLDDDIEKSAEFNKNVCFEETNLKPPADLSVLKKERAALLAEVPQNRQINISGYKNQNSSPLFKLQISAVGANQLKYCNISDFDIVWLPPEEILKNKNLKFDCLGARLPVLTFDSDNPGLITQLKKVKALGVKKALVSGSGMLELCRRLGFETHCDYGFNPFNSESLNAAAELGAQSAVLSFELRFAQIKAVQAPFPCGIICYGRLPLMHTRCCVKFPGGCKTTVYKSECADNRKFTLLTDRKEEKFLVKCEHGCCNTIYNSKPLYLADLDFYKDSGAEFFRFDFTDETPEQCASILKEYKNKSKRENGFTRGLYYKGIL